MTSTLTRTVAGIIAAAGIVVAVAACDPADTATANGNDVQTVQPVGSTATPTRALTVSQSQAIAAAEQYNRTLPFSRQGLIDQLSSEYGSGFDVETATFAVDDLEQRGEIDYMANAAKAAQQYLDTVGGFSAQSLHDQLVFEGYTDEQAAHGVTSVGL